MILTEFYKVLCDRLADNIADVKFCDYYPGSLEALEPHNVPAVYVQFDPVAFQTLGRKRQATDLSFDLIVVMPYLHSTSTDATTAIRNNGLAHFALIDQVSTQLQGWNGNADSLAVGSLSRTDVALFSEGLQGNDNGSYLTGHRLSYRCRITDDAASTNHALADPQPAMNLITTI